MTEQEVAEAVAAWLPEKITALQTSYAYLPSQRSALPDAACEVTEKRIVRGEEERRFPFTQLQQADLRVFEILVSFMVGADGSDEGETQQLQSFGALLEQAILTDTTMGDRVFMTSPFAVFDYRFPFIQYHDGTRGRQMEANIAVGELIEGIS